MPFNNYPDRWTYDYTHIVVSECLYSNKVISVIFTGDILREFYGIGVGICTYLILTTYPSPIDGTVGFRSALNPGCFGIQFYSMEGSNVLESSLDNTCIVSSPSSNMNIYSSTIDANTNSIYRLEFIANADIPNGYFYMDGTNPGSQGTIVLQFEPYQSFAYDLAGQYTSDFQVYCNAIQGLVPKTGENLKCQLTVGVVNLPPPSLQHDPAIITVTNFQAVTQGTFISLHFPIIRNPSTVGNVPQITAGVYKTDYTGLVT